MNYPKTLLIIVAVILAILPVQQVHADGMFIAPEGSFVYEYAQQAVLQYNVESRLEELTILPHFHGDSSEFAWIVPVPNLPEVTLASGQIFWDLDSISRPVYQSRDGQWDCFGESRTFAIADAENGAPVEIISTELVGYYQTMVVSATESTVLADSLSNWGFLHQGNTETVMEALDYYVNLGWYFVAMQVDAEALERTAKSTSAPYYSPYYGGLDPVKFSFISDEIIYPMKISALSADAYTQVNLYVITNHRMLFPGAETFYANKFAAHEIADLVQYPSLGNLFDAGDFMTKLQRRYIPSEMAEDVLLTQAPNDNEYIMIRYSGFPWTGLLLFGPAGVWLAIRRRKLF